MKLYTLLVAMFTLLKGVEEASMGKSAVIK